MFFIGVMAFFLLYLIGIVICGIGETGFLGAVFSLVADISVISDIRNKAEAEGLSEEETGRAIDLAMDIMHGDEEKKERS